MALQQEEGRPNVRPLSPIIRPPPNLLIDIVTPPIDKPPPRDGLHLPPPPNAHRRVQSPHQLPTHRQRTPLRDLSFTTNAIGTVPERLEAWQTYTGPLDRSGMKTRRWEARMRSIRTIGGGEWFGKTWIGGRSTFIDVFFGRHLTGDL